MYAEFVACYEASGQVTWLKKFVPGLRVVDSIEKPLKLYCDNEPAVFYAHNDKSSGADKHIDIKFYVVKEQVQDETICLEYIRTDKMLAYPLTKVLPPNVFREHLAGMGLRESLWFLDEEWAKEKNFVSDQKGNVNLTVIIVMMRHALYTDLWWDDSNEE